MTGSDRLTLIEGWALEVLFEVNSSDLDLEIPKDWKRAIRGAIKKVNRATATAREKEHADRRHRKALLEAIFQSEVPT